MLISVIIPTCNRPDRVLNSVNSVLSQQLRFDFEIIVVDDSKNSIVDDLSELLKDNNVNIVRNPNGGSAAKSRNFGASLAKGKYITFLDDDDLYLFGRLNNMLSIIMDSEKKYSFISSGRFYEKNNFSTVKLSKQKFGVIKLDDIKYKNCIDIGFIVERSFFFSIGGFDDSLQTLEDWDLIIRMLKLKPGYKVNRLDYIVNYDQMDRVTNKEHYGYERIAEKYKNEFGLKWYYSVISESLKKNNALSFSKMVSLAFKAKSFNPIFNYIKQILG